MVVSSVEGRKKFRHDKPSLQAEPVVVEPVVVVIGAWSTSTSRIISRILTKLVAIVTLNFR